MPLCGFCHRDILGKVRTAQVTVEPHSMSGAYTAFRKGEDVLVVSCPHCDAVLGVVTTPSLAERRNEQNPPR